MPIRWRVVVQNAKGASGKSRIAVASRSEAPAGKDAEATGAARACAISFDAPAGSILLALIWAGGVPVGLNHASFASKANMAARKHNTTPTTMRLQWLW